MALPGGVTILALVAVCVIGVGVILHIIGLATTEWSFLHKYGETLEHGLWKACINYPFNLFGAELANSIRSCRAFAILGMLAGILGLVMAAVSVLFPIIGKPNDPRFPAISLAVCVAAFISILITIIVWPAVIHQRPFSGMDIGYSFILSIVGGILIGVGASSARQPGNN